MYNASGGKEKPGRPDTTEELKRGGYTGPEENTLLPGGENVRKEVREEGDR